MTQQYTEQDRFDNLKRLHEARGNLAYALEVFGHELARREGYKNIDGMEAIYLYLIRKYSWLPREVRAMSQSDLELALHQEMQDWTLPPAAR